MSELEFPINADAVNSSDSEPKNNAEKNPEKPKKTKIFRSGLLTLIVATLLLLFVSVELFSDHLIVWSLQSVASEKTGSRIAVKKANASLIGQNLTLDGLRISPQSSGEEDDALLEAAEANVKVQLFKMISGKFWVDDVSVRDSVVQLIRDEKGTFNFDPGPPPETESPTPDEPPAEEFPDEDRDVVQEVGDLLERLRTYKEYYDKLKGEDSSDEEEEEAPRRYPGRASYVTSSVEAKSPGFWLKQFSIENASLRSIDKRTGQSILPEFDQFVLRVTDVSDQPETIAEPMKVQMAATPKGSGPWSLLYRAAHGNRRLNLLELSLDSVPLQVLTSLVSESLPFDLQGGKISITSLQRKAALDGDWMAPEGPLQFDLRTLRGAVAISLDGVRLHGSEMGTILGFPLSTFSQLFNYAMEQVPLRLVFSLDGRPSSPKIRLLNGRQLMESLRDVASQAAEAKLRELAAQVTERLSSEVDFLQNRARDEIDSLKADATNLLDKGRSGIKGGLKDVEGSLDSTLGNKLDGTPLEGLKDKHQGGLTDKANELLNKSDKIGDTEKLDGKVDNILNKPDKATDDLTDNIDKGIGKLFGGKKKDPKEDDSKKDPPKEDPPKKDKPPKKEKGSGGGGG